RSDRLWRPAGSCWACASSVAQVDGAMNRALRLLPVILVIWIVGTFAWRLIEANDPTIRSQLVNRSIPPFQLAAAVPGAAGLKSADLATGKPRLLNLFASWGGP